MKKQYILAGVVVVGIIIMAGVLLWPRAKTESPTLVPNEQTSASVSPATCRNFQEGTVTVAGQTFNVAVADTQAERIQGLAACPQLPDTAGMFFTYSESELARYWMQGMLLPLDIIWIANGRVVGVAENAAVVPTGENPPVYQAPQPVDAVLEIAAGKAQEYGIAVGASVEFQSK